MALRLYWLGIWLQWWYGDCHAYEAMLHKNHNIKFEWMFYFIWTTAQHSQQQQQVLFIFVHIRCTKTKFSDKVLYYF